MDASAEPARGEGKQPASGPYVHKACSRKIAATKQVANGLLCLDDLAGGQVAREVEPVIAKPKTAILAFPVRHHPNHLKTIGTARQGLRCLTAGGNARRSSAIVRILKSGGAQQ